MLATGAEVSVLFNEPKLLKFGAIDTRIDAFVGFSALQRAEIAEIQNADRNRARSAARFSALQRAEIAEISSRRWRATR